MAKITWNPKGPADGKNQSPMVWGCHLFLREDGTFEMDFKGETGFQMAMAAMDALHRIDRVRREQAYDFGASNSRDSSKISKKSS